MFHDLIPRKLCKKRQSNRLIILIILILFSPLFRMNRKTKYNKIRAAAMTDVAEDKCQNYQYVLLLLFSK